MDEIHFQILQAQHLTFWALVVIATEGFFSLVLLAIGLSLGRGTRHEVLEVSQSVENVARILERVDERSERLGYYLFTKLGPAETK